MWIRPDVEKFGENPVFFNVKYLEIGFSALLHAHCKKTGLMVPYKILSAKVGAAKKGTGNIR